MLWIAPSIIIITIITTIIMDTLEIMAAILEEMSEGHAGYSIKVLR
jgi:hypothetical protein